jgi:hypothetical chaperone protein
VPRVRAEACGIDFGTSNSTVACASGSDGGAVQLLALEADKLNLPSAVFFHAEDEDVSYGRAALRDYLAGYDGRLMRSLKSLLGTSMIDEQTNVAGRPLAFRDLLAQFIGELKRRAEQSAGREFACGVLGRPVFFVDDDDQADRQAQNTLADIARSVGLKDLVFQYEPIAAAFAYEAQVAREELVLVVDIGGGTSDFALVRLGPGRASRADRRDDILASAGVHIGGTDFDKYLSLATVMPLLGLGSQLKSGLDMPSAQYFNLATWHTINLAYSKRSTVQIDDMHREAREKNKLVRLQRLVAERDGHWLAMQVEEAKISLSDMPAVAMGLGRIAPGETRLLQRSELDTAIGGLVNRVAASVEALLGDAGILANDVDTVFFTGGASSVLLLRQQIAMLLPQARRVEGDLLGSIGTGLALEAVKKFA